MSELAGLDRWMSEGMRVPENAENLET